MKTWGLFDASIKLNNDARWRKATYAIGNYSKSRYRKVKNITERVNSFEFTLIHSLSKTLDSVIENFSKALVICKKFLILSSRFVFFFIFSRNPTKCISSRVHLLFNRIKFHRTVPSRQVTFMAECVSCHIPIHDAVLGKGNDLVISSYFNHISTFL